MSGPAKGEDAPANRPPMSRGKFALALGFCLAGIAILAALGTWQLERLQSKEALIARIEVRLHGNPIPLDAAVEAYQESGDIDYQPVTVSGRFLNGGERFFFSTSDGASGWDVYTPLLTDDDRLLMVNRGFVPYAMRDPATRPGSRPDGQVTIEGIARNAPTEKPGYFVPDNEPRNKTFFWRDLRALTGGLALEPGVRLVPFFVDAARDPNSNALPIGGQTIVSIPNNHLQYAFTWYGIGLVLVVMTGMLVAGRLKLRRARGRNDA